MYTAVHTIVKLLEDLFQLPPAFPHYDSQTLCRLTYRIFTYIFLDPGKLLASWLN